MFKERNMPVQRSLLTALSAACVLVVGGTAAPQSSTIAQPAALADPAPSPNLPSAPFAHPAEKTLFQFGDRATTITRSEGWRTWFVDEKENQGGFVGGFVPDHPSRPLAFSEQRLAEFWPLQVGKAIDIVMARDTNSWLWRLRVIGTEEVTVPAGTYKTFVIEGIEASQQSGPDLRPITTLYQWWYAPKINFVVRLMERRITGPMTDEQPRRTELRKIVKLD